MRSTGQLKFIVSSIGTQGDLQPMLALAEELVRRGHRCHMLGSASAEARATERGVEYTTISPTQTNNVVSTEVSFATYIFPSYEPTFRAIERELAQGNQLVVVNRSKHSATTVACERHGLPLCRIYLAPAQVRSLAAPPWPWHDRAKGRLGTAFKRYYLPKIYEGYDAHPYILRNLNAHREALGLRPITNLEEHEQWVHHQLGFFPEWYAAPASDWPSMDMVGFPLPQSAGTLPAELERLIQRHGRPLVFTPGTGVPDVDQFFAAARRCCGLLDRPGVFLSPHYSAACAENGGKILHFPFIELGQLLRDAALLVHHGGIGTAARALEAGIPQIISPQAYDQPDNGRRVSELGVGAVIERSRLSGETLAAAAAPLLQSEEVARKLSVFSTCIAQTHAVEQAADRLEQRFVTAPPVPRAARVGAVQFRTAQVA
jgi:UDP:flavonoid glycosyltransferase YjiC (YdhE family)